MHEQMHDWDAQLTTEAYDEWPGSPRPCLALAAGPPVCTENMQTPPYLAALSSILQRGDALIPEFALWVREVRHVEMASLGEKELEGLFKIYVFDRDYGAQRCAATSESAARCQSVTLAATCCCAGVSGCCQLPSFPHAHIHMHIMSHLTGVSGGCQLQLPPLATHVGVHARTHHVVTEQ